MLRPKKLNPLRATYVYRNRLGFRNRHTHILPGSLYMRRYFLYRINHKPSTISMLAAYQSPTESPCHNIYIYTHSNTQRRRLSGQRQPSHIYLSLTRMHEKYQNLRVPKAHINWYIVNKYNSLVVNLYTRTKCAVYLR